MTYRVDILLGDAILGYLTPDDVFLNVHYPVSTDPEDGTATLELTGDRFDEVRVLDGLSMSWRYASDELNAQLEPLQAQVHLEARNARKLSLLAVGDLAVVRLSTDPAGDVVAAVYGRVAEVTATTALRWDKLEEQYVPWTRFDVTIADHTATADEPVDITYENLDLDELTSELGAAIDTPLRHSFMTDQFAAGVTGGPRDTDNIGVITLLKQYLGWMPVGDEADVDPIPHGFLHLAPVSLETGELALLSLHLIDWRNVVPVTLPGGRVELGGTWRRGPEAAVNTVTVMIPETAGYPAVKARVRAAGWLAGDPVIKRSITTEDGIFRPTENHADMLAAAYLPDPDDAGWSLDTFRWLPEDVADLADAWFPNWSTEAYSADVFYTPVGDDPIGEPAAPCFRSEVTITDVHPDANLAGGSTYTGKPLSVELTLAGGRLAVDFALRRTA